MTRLSSGARRVLSALAAAAIPPGRILPGAGASTVADVEALLSPLGATALRSYEGMLWTLELSSLHRGARFSRLPLGRRLKVLGDLERGDATRSLLRVLLAPLKLTHFEGTQTYDALGCRYAVDDAPRERPRWLQQIIPGATLAGSGELECDAVVVGTGAGGAPIAHALAERGHAVLLVEEGAHYTRADFTGRPLEMMRKLYRAGGFLAAVGNTVIPIPVGRAVGGTTLINSGTCFRTPASTLAAWRAAGLDEFTPGCLEPYFERVEQVLGVAPAEPQFIGAPGRLIARGCDVLGYSHHPLARNAPGCDGQGLCCFGCPTDAKRSTNVSYVPMALERGAQLITGLRVERVLVDGETATGIVGTARGAAGQRIEIRVRARVVVLACGALHTPALLLKNRLCNGSDQLGRNLSIHPASGALGLFDEEVNAWKTVPQGYAIDEFKEEGILFEGGSVPLGFTALAHPGFGPRFTALMEQYHRVLNFGVMVKDTSRGRVRVDGSGRPQITYWLNRADVAKLQRALVILARVFLAAGAREVYPAVAGFERIRSERDVEALGRAHLAARNIDITAYHPLGTARMGIDPLRSVVGPTHETHDIHNLYVCDGSAVPGSLGVNPQITLMALSLRAAEHVSRRLERLAALAAA